MQFCGLKLTYLFIQPRLTHLLELPPPPVLGPELGGEVVGVEPRPDVLGRPLREERQPLPVQQTQHGRLVLQQPVGRYRVGKNKSGNSDFCESTLESTQYNNFTIELTHSNEIS